MLLLSEEEVLMIYQEGDLLGLGTTRAMFGIYKDTLKDIDNVKLAAITAKEDKKFAKKGYKPLKKLSIEQKERLMGKGRTEARVPGLHTHTELFFATLNGREYIVETLGSHFDKKTAKEDKQIDRLCPIYINEKGQINWGELSRNSSFMKRR